MIVIEGKHQKSVKLENLLRKELRTENVLVIDTIGLRGIEGFDILSLKSFSTEDVIKMFQELYSKGYSKYDWIAFYVNAEVSTIESFKELDRKYPQNFIVTIQNNDLGLTSVYHI